VQAGGRYTGLPTDLAIIELLARMLLDGPLDLAAFQVALNGAALTVAGLMVSSLPIPS
jgi:phosphatidylserine synthase